MKTMYHIHKGIHTITALLSAAVLLLLTTVIAACAEADFLDGSQQLPPTDGLAVMPSAWEMKVPTRLDDYHDANWTNNDDTDESNIEDDDELREGDIGEKLDVFIAGVTTPTFWKEYHLTKGQLFAGATAKVQDNQLDVLATGNWFDSEGITAGQTYDVYVAVNTEATHPEGGVGSKTALMALTNTNADVDKLYKAQSDLNNSIENRRMMMDGHTQWTPTTDLNQTISVQLNRAEAKVVAHITFDPAFYLTRTRTDGYTIGSPMWKYVNWDQKTRVFADATPLSLNELELQSNSGRAYPTVEGVESSYDYYYTETEGVKTYYSTIDVVEESGHFFYYQPGVNPADPPTKIEVLKATSDMAVDIPYIDIITYTYAFGWGNEPMKYAPYILVSYGYSKNQSTSYNYYRIPLVDESTTKALRRNHIYRSSAVIAGNGSASLEEYFNPVKLRYEVVDWTERDSQLSKVNGDRLYFFNLEPTLYNVYGEGAGTTADPKYRTQVISYSAHSDAQVRLSNIEVYFNNNDGKKPIATIPGGNNTTSVGNLATDGYHIEVNQATQQIIVQTSVLKNHAVKFIKFRAYTSDRSDWQTQGFYADVTVKHFPIDNIQSIEGSWSSKYTSVNNSVQTPVYVEEDTYDPSIGAGWEGTEGYRVVEEETTEALATETRERVGGTYNNNNGHIVKEEVTSQEFRQAINSNTNQQNANREANARLVNGWYYWGEGTPTASDRTTTAPRNYSNPYDYYTYYSSWGTTYYTYYTYPNRYRAQYYVNYYVRNHYYHQALVGYNPSITSNWVMWDTDQASHRTQKTTSDSPFNAKVYYFDTRDNQYYCAPIVDYRESNNNYKAQVREWNYSTWFGTEYYPGYYYDVNDLSDYSRYDNLQNNHMYVIQITATSSDYVLGRPTLDGNKQSDDHVVSPAFMIASQLGAVSSTWFTEQSNPGREAAKHCGQYMEVDVNGKKWTGWRLPTAEEIKVITKYQYDPDVQADGIMSEVLGGRYYYTLDGKTQETKDTNTGTAVRCIRDLSAEEVKILNESNK